MVAIPVIDDKDVVESGATPKDEKGFSVKDDLNFSWDDLPDKFMREEYELRMPSSTDHVSEDIKVMNLQNLTVQQKLCENNFSSRLTGCFVSNFGVHNVDPLLVKPKCVSRVVVLLKNCKQTAKECK